MLDLSGLKILDNLDNVKLNKNEYLLKVHGCTGFMVKLNMDGSVPKAFKNWYGSSATAYVVEEDFRTGWLFVGLRAGMSTAWIQLKHPLGFTLEINGKGFNKVCRDISMNNGVITTPCRFLPSLKNAELEVKN